MPRNRALVLLAVVAASAGPITSAAHATLESPDSATVQAAIDSAGVAAPESTSNVVSARQDSSEAPRSQLRAIDFEPDAALRAKLRGMLNPQSRVRLASDLGVLVLSDVEIGDAGLRGTPVASDYDAPPSDSVVTLPWRELHSLQVQRRPVGSGAFIGGTYGTVLGVLPGVMLLAIGAGLSSESDGWAAVGGVFTDIGMNALVVYGTIGAGAGIVSGALVGAMCQEWHTWYVAPVIMLRSDPLAGPVNRIAVGRMVEQMNHGWASGQGARTITLTLKELGYQVVDRRNVRTALRGDPSESGLERRSPKPYPAATLDLLREHTGADAVLSGSFSAKGDDVRCDLTLVDTRTHEVLMTCAYVAGTSLSTFNPTRPAGRDPRVPRNMARRVLAPLTELRHAEAPQR